ncbi:hypothetical protein [Streptomyces parvulus]|uniref:hypothetical protein n=1 Tax=Streptomyces parvulus TaxID=146923 RepID=UPI0033B1E744
MHLRRTEPSRIFHVTGGGAGLDPTHTCEHGSPSVSFHLFSEHHGRTEDICLVLSMCSSPGLFGAAVAFIDEALGSDEGDKFMAAIQKARELATREIDRAKAAQRAAEDACCEAGYRTQDREHTCGRRTPPTT